MAMTLTSQSIVLNTLVSAARKTEAELQMREDGVGRVEARAEVEHYVMLEWPHEGGCQVKFRINRDGTLTQADVSPAKMRFYIGSGWPGYDSPANKDGYSSAEEARTASIDAYVD